MSLELLIVFYCRSGTTESLALAAAVGAVQARAHIRLRRLRDAAVAVESLSDQNNLRRMQREYVAPTEADFVRADAIIFVAPADFTPENIEWIDCFKLLGKLGAEGKLVGKVGAVLAETDFALQLLSETILGLGFTVVPGSSPDPVSQGRTTVFATMNQLKK